ncbi:hypothetical protein DFH29DRAFT_69734 [Suillus ampliporus]|nr:hypothetical protein DFH29DRAFT_69734 [Suillus ampliporus]
MHHVSESEVMLDLTSYSRTVGILIRSTLEGAIWNDDMQISKDADGTALPLSSTTAGFKLSLSEPGVPRDAAITHIQPGCGDQSSEDITVSTTSVQTLSHSSTESSEGIRRQSVKTFSCSDGPAIDGKVDQANSSALVRLSLAHEVNMHVDPAVIPHPHAVVQRSITLDSRPHLGRRIKTNFTMLKRGDMVRGSLIPVPPGTSDDL